MADLLIKSRSKSWLRQYTDTFLNVTFPLWGLVSPIVLCIGMFCLCTALLQGTKNLLEHAAFFVLIAVYSLSSLLLKRAISNDALIITKDGITLPIFSGGAIRLKTKLPWQRISLIDADLDISQPDKASIKLLKSPRGHESMALKNLEPDFIEQLVMAFRMWVPEKCSPQLDQLQGLARLESRKSEHISYTDLWEDELSRRFCPTQYVALEAGRVLRNNTLTVVRQLATGGLSALYLCQQGANKLVVLKEACLPQQSSEDLKEKARELFDREAKLLMKVDNPGVVHVLDCFTEGGRNYMLLEHVNGIDLWQLVHQNGPQRETDVLEWAIQMATTLKYLHEREIPIIHRDVTPDNMILRNDGKVILVDFGAANELISNATGTFVGKHSFIAPEQLRGKASAQSDIYSFGCTLYFLLVGRDPEAFSTSNVRADQIAFNENKPENKIVLASEEMSQLVEACTQLEARDRYQSMAQLLPVLKRLSAHLAA